MTEPQKTIEEITSCFENSTKSIQYSYVEALGDGRGYTAGKAGFTTGTGDAYEVCFNYLLKYESTDLEALMPLLKKYANEESGSVEGLENFPRVWKALSTTPEFRAAQDAECDKLYFDPAMKYVEHLGLETNLAKAIFYDTIIQHGDGEDGDSIGAIVRKTGDMKEEGPYLQKFLANRRADLMNPKDKSTTEEWRGSVDRVDALNRLLKAGNYSLKSPFKLEVFGDTYQF